MRLFKFLLPDLMQDVLRLLASVDCCRGVPDKDKLLNPPLLSGSGSDLRKYDVHGEFCVYGDLHSARYRDNRYDSYLARCLVYGVFSSFSLVFLEITALSGP